MTRRASRRWPISTRRGACCRSMLLIWMFLTPTWIFQQLACDSWRPTTSLTPGCVCCVRVAQVPFSTRQCNLMVLGNGRNCSELARRQSRRRFPFLACRVILCNIELLIKICHSQRPRVLSALQLIASVTWLGEHLVAFVPRLPSPSVTLLSSLKLVVAR